MRGNESRPQDISRGNALLDLLERFVNESRPQGAGTTNDAATSFGETFFAALYL